MARRSGRIELTADQLAELRQQQDQSRSQFDAIVESQGIRSIRSPVTEHMLRPLANCKVLQTSSLLLPEEYEAVAGLLRTAPDVSFRVFAQILEPPIENVDFLKHFSDLRRFSIDSWFIKSLDGLRYLPRDLIELGLGESAWKKPISWITDLFPEVHDLSIASKVDDIKAIGRLKKLQKLRVLGCTFDSLESLKSLSSLEHFVLMGGTTKNLAGLEQLQNLKYLEVTRNTALEAEDLTPVARLPQLQFLSLNWLPGVTQVPSFEAAQRLRRVDIDTLHRLVDIGGLRPAPSLETLCVMGVKSLSPDAFQSLAGHPQLRSGLIWLGSRTRTNLAEKILQLKRPEYAIDFEYR